MFQSKKCQLAYRLFYIVLLSYGLVFDFLGWVHQPYNEFMVYYTTQSNLLCLVVMVILAILIFKDLRQGIIKGRSHHLVKLEFVVCTYILLTCLIYNFLLGNPFEASYWTSNRYNYIVHLFGPILFIGDFLLLSERGSSQKRRCSL